MSTTEYDLEAPADTALHHHHGQPIVYLAEDDDDVRETLAELLVHDGFHVRAAPDGDCMFEWLFRAAEPEVLPDAIVTDHRMPGYTALDILEGLQQLGLTIPVILITAFGSEVRALARARGACAVFEKPFDPAALRTAVMHCINWKVRRVRPSGNDGQERKLIRRARAALRRTSGDWWEYDA